MVATLGMLIFIVIRGAEEILNTAAEHGFLITTSKFAVAVLLSTVAVRVYEYVA